MTATTANRAIKARAKATPSRIQVDIKNAQVIIERKIVSNDILHIAETEELSIADLPPGQVSVPLNLWLEHKPEIQARGAKIAVQLAADEDPEDLLDDLQTIDIIVLPFVDHVDGRGYSHAHKLRKRYGFRGQIRAIGDVKFDQLDFLNRAGCDAFELSGGEGYESALRAFSEFSEVYQPATDSRRLIFSRRRSIH